MKALKSISIIAAVIIVLFAYSSLYTVDEGQQGLLIKLGKLVTNSASQPVVVNPGLHAKWPLIEQAQIFDTRLQTLDIQSSRIVTAEKKDLLVDYYVKWRITNLALYYTTTSGNIAQAQQLLQQSLNDALRAQFGRRTIRDVVSDERSKIMAALLTQANLSAQTLGLSVTDVRIKRIDLPSEVSKSVYDRMRAERERVATEHRSLGKAKAEAIRANADATVTITIAKATAEAALIRAQGDAAAAKIYATAYQQDPAFYSFFQSLNAYRATFTKNDILVLQPDSQFFKYFNGVNLNNDTNSTETTKTAP